MYDYLKPIDDGLPMRESGPWAKEKLDYLDRYINIFETSMREKWKKRNYIDLLAGPGKNRIRKSGEVLLGSPLLALVTTHPFSGYFFVDNDPANNSALSTRCAASILAQQIRIIREDCNLAVDSIVTELRKDEHQSLNLAFLDPEGLELHWATVFQLASISRMDLIINYPKNGLSRNMKKWVDSEFENPIDQFFGGREWREIFLKVPKSSRHRELIDLYKRSLQALGYVEIKNSDDFGDEPLMKNEKRAPLYHLLFASKSSLGHKFWHEVTKRNVYGQKRLFDSY